MAVKAFLLLCFLSLLTQSRTENYCRDLEHVTVGQCCSGGSCCFEDENPDLACCCDEDCFKYGDCCLDIIEIGCPIPYGQQLPNYCSIYPGLYNCTAFDITDGCCVGDDCTISSPSGECCSCDKDCHISSRQDCCPDINTIGCPCNNTCSAHYFTGGCCTGNPNSCHTTCPDYCFCDEMCHNRGDCCSDIEDIGCRSPLTLPPVIVCPQQTINVTVWPETNQNSFAYVSCSVGMTGNYSRFCSVDGIWNNTIINSCRSPQLDSSEEQIEDILSGNSTLSNDEVQQAIENITKIAIDVSSHPDTPAFPEDLATINRLVSSSLTLLLQSDSTNETNIIQPYGLLTVVDNLLDIRYENTWSRLNLDVGAPLLMENVEKLGRYTGKVVVLNQTTGQQIEDRKNIDLQAEVVRLEKARHRFSSSDASNVDEEGYIQIDIFEQDLRNDEPVAVVNAIVKNIVYFLLAANSDSGSDLQAGTDIISTQVVSVDETYSLHLTLNFTTKTFVTNVTDPRCAFWNFTGGPDGAGNFSEEGIQTLFVSSDGPGEDGEPIQFIVTCNSSHMTPFLVLVDAHGVLDKITPEERLGLRILTYVGISVSCICLILTIIFLLLLKKELVKQVQFFVHFNLCLALLIGYLIFLFFIDDSIFKVTNSKVGCAFIAGVLHYFLLAAFSWMLCEGIMLFLLLVVVFSTISKRWYIFLIIGWGLPIFPVAISAGIIHDAYGVQGKFCWLDPNKRGAIWAFLGPMIAIILANVLFLIMSLRALINYYSKTLKSKEKKKKGAYVFRKTILGAVTLLPILGITWIIAVLSINAYTTVFAWLFVAFASLQGLLIFVVNIIRNEKIRETIAKRFLNVKKKISSSTFNSKYKTKLARSSSFRSSVAEKSRNPSFRLTEAGRSTASQAEPTFQTLDRKKIMQDLKKHRGSEFFDNNETLD